MKVVIFAGGQGTRLGEETKRIPKPMVEIGGYPIIWHIMKIYSHYGYNDFVVLTGYKQEIIKDYFVNYHWRNSNVTVDLANGNMNFHQQHPDDWKVTLWYTGRDTLTGARLKRAKEIIGNEPFLLTYGDGLSDVDINKIVEFHKKSKKLCTITAIQPSSRFGILQSEEDGLITNFKEKMQELDTWVNGGFMVCEPEVLNYIPDGDGIIWEQEPFQNMIRDKQLNAYKHYGFWKSLDTPKDKNELNELWDQNKSLWKVWDK